MDDIFDFVKGKKPKKTSSDMKDNYIPHILISAFDGKYSEYADIEGMVICDVSETLMVMDGASSGLITIGHKGVVGSTLAKLKLKKEELWFYSHEFLKLKTSDIQIKHNWNIYPSYG